MPATIESVQTHLGLSPARPVDTEALTAAVAAANDTVAALRPDLTTDGAWTPRADQAATVYAARLYGRRGSVVGVAAFPEAGVSMLPNTDPDVAMMLELGKHQRSVVA